MRQFDNSRHFSRWQDPQSGVTTYLLHSDVAPHRQSFYFTNPSLSADGRYFWFYCAHPPSGRSDYGRTLAVWDGQQDRITHFPDTQFSDASPWVEPETGWVYWCNHTAIWKRSPCEGEAAVLVADLSQSLIKNRFTHRIATHLSRSANKRELFVDAQIGGSWIAGSVNLADGQFTAWQEFERCYNHAQFSPLNPDLALIAQDHWLDPLTGVLNLYENRMWLLKRGQQAQPIFAEGPFRKVTHEWWEPEGEAVWFIQNGVYRVDIHGGEPTKIWDGGTWHSHLSSNLRYLVGDEAVERPWSRGSASRVRFYNRETEREATIISHNPRCSQNSSSYHIDPHPQFLAGDGWIAHTTTVEGRVNVGLTPVSQLLSLTQ